MESNAEKQVFYQIQIEINEKDKHKNPICYYELDRTDRAELIDSIIKPFLNGEEFWFNGYFISKAKINRLLVKTTEKTTKELAKYENDHMPRNIIMYVSPEAIVSYDKYTTDITKSVFEEAKKNVIPQKKSLKKNTINDFSKVFIVHGHDELAKIEVARFIEKLGFEAIILSEQANEGKTIIEKIEEYSDVDFGIVLYTPCDVGSEKDTNDFKPRARQNVVFEHGYLIGKLGREKVHALKKDNVETPNDISGIVYTEMDPGKAWQIAIAKEMKKVGYDIDFNKIM